MDPRSVAIADLNGDGMPDVVTSNHGAFSASVLEGFGDGTLDHRLDYGVQEGPSAVAIGDMNRDGRPDVVIANEISASITVLLNRRPTPIETQAPRVEASLEGCKITWQLSPESRQSLAGVIVQRAVEMAGPYSDRTGPLAPESEMTFEDPDVQSGVQYWYRVVLQYEDGRQKASAAASVTAVAKPGHEVLLHRPYVETGGGPVHIPYTVFKSVSRVRLAIFDIRGRRLWSTTMNVRGAGKFEALWGRETSRRTRVPRGMYLVSLEAARRRTCQKFMLATR
jgi:hypothetical protein